MSLFFLRVYLTAFDSLQHEWTIRHHSLLSHFNASRTTENIPELNFKQIKAKIAEAFAHVACKWQLLASFITFLRKNAIVISATGSGKTLPIFIPLLFVPNLLIIFLSPLNVLCAQFEATAKEWGFKAVAVTEDNAADVFSVSVPIQYFVFLSSYSLLFQKVHEYQVVIMPPERALGDCIPGRLLTSMLFNSPQFSP